MMRNRCSLTADPAAFGVFYDRHERLVAGYLARRLRDPALVADLIGEVLPQLCTPRGATGPTSPARRDGCSRSLTTRWPNAFAAVGSTQGPSSARDPRRCQCPGSRA